MRWLIFLLLLAPAVAAAQPSITSVSGTAEQDSSLSISGSGFGTKSPAAPILWDILSNQSAYSGLSNDDEVPVKDDGCSTCPWKEHIPVDWGQPPKYHTTAADLRVSGRPVYSVDRKGYFRTGDYGLSSDGELYINWWLWHSENLYNAVGGLVFNKLLRVWTNTDGDNRKSWESQMVAFNGWNGSSIVEIDDNYPYTFTDSTWTHLEAWIKSETDMTEGGGTFKFWKNNALLTSDLTSLASTTGPYDVIYVFGSDPHDPDRYSAGMKTFFGSVYIDSTQSRVVIGDANTIPLCTHTEIQIPTAWSAASITVDVNQGSFAGSSTGYLYVYDSSGDHNSNGYEITWGEDTPIGPATPDPVDSLWVIDQ